MKLHRLFLALVATTLTGAVAAGAPRLAALAELDRPLERLESSVVVIPEALKNSGADDTVTMDVVIAPDGKVARVEAVKSSTPEGAAAATTAVKRWLFTRPLAQGEPVSVTLPVTIAIRPRQVTDAAADLDERVGALGGALVASAEPRFEMIPEYPATLTETPVDGYAVVGALVDEQGRAGDVVIEYASRPEFSAPAAAVLPTWIFTPTRSGGKAVAARTSVRVEFSATSARWTPEQRDLHSRLRYVRDYDDGPREKTSKPVVFPYDALLAEKGGGVMLQVVIGPDGRVAHVVPEPGAEVDYAHAVRASLAYWTFFPATRAGQPVFGQIQMQFTFDPGREEFEFDASTLELITGLRAGTAEVFSLKQVDQYPKPVTQIAPVFPSDHEGPVAGDASIECIIDRAGRPQLPRIVRASSPEFGWAAATAVAQWRFEPARKDGKPVVSRARLPIRVTGETPAAPASP